jgi:uncharacterized membrane protein (DUF373 family)
MTQTRVSRIWNTTIAGSNSIVSLCIFVGMVGIVAYLGFTVWNIMGHSLSFDFQRMLRDIALLIILVKAYRILLYYFRQHHISIKYIVEIAIIAPAIELIFAPLNHTFEISILLAVFAMVNLTLYLLFFENLSKADEEECRESHVLDVGQHE